MKITWVTPISLVVLGVLAGLISGFFLVLTDGKLFNSLLWRLESLQSKPVVSQVIYERYLHNHFLGLEPTLKPGAILFFGDSIVQLMPTHELAGAVNFGIGGESIERLAQRLPKYKSIGLAGAIVVNGGANDVFESKTPAQIEASWLQVLAHFEASFKGLGARPKIICLGLAGASFTALNQTIRSVCEKNSASFVNPTPSDAQGYSPDKIHLSPAGYRPVLEQLKTLLPTIRYHGTMKKESYSC
jgi:lysophospholipase L1-like esterase